MKRVLIILVSLLSLSAYSQIDAKRQIRNLDSAVADLGYTKGGGGGIIGKTIEVDTILSTNNQLYLEREVLGENFYIGRPISFANSFFLAYRGLQNGTDYALNQTSTGVTTLNHKSGGRIKFSSNGVEGATFKDGKLGINNNAPSFGLDVTSNARIKHNGGSLVLSDLNGDSTTTTSFIEHRNSSGESLGRSGFYTEANRNLGLISYIGDINLVPKTGKMVLWNTDTIATRAWARTNISGGSGTTYYAGANINISGDTISATGSGSVGNADSLGGVPASSYALFSNVVNLTTNQSVAGIKNLTSFMGLNVASPLARLHIRSGNTTGSVQANYDDLLIENAGNVGLTFLSRNSDIGGVAFGDLESNVQGLITYSHPNDRFDFYTNATRQMAIHSDGDVGIGTGTTTPASKLEVNGVITWSGGNSTGANAAIVRLDSLIDNLAVSGSGFKSCYKKVTSNFTVSATDTSCNIQNVSNSEIAVTFNTISAPNGSVINFWNNGDEGSFRLLKGTSNLKIGGENVTSDTVLATASVMYANDTFYVANGATSSGGGTPADLSDYYTKSQVDSALIQSDTIDLTVSRSLTSTDAGKYLRFAGTDTIWINAVAGTMNSGQKIEFTTYNFKNNGRIGFYSSSDTIKDIEGNVLDSVLLPPLSEVYYKHGGVFIIKAENGSKTGWADYVDTEYTSGSPFSITANDTVTLPNNGGIIRNVQAPFGIDLFSVVDTAITGRNGDGILITVEFKCLPTNPATTYLDTWIDIGGAVGPIYQRTISFPKGNGVLRNINFTTAAYTLDTWEANGGKVKISANGTADIYDIRIVVYRTHAAE